MSSGSPITTHILDTAHGCPATGVAVTLEKQSGTEWTRVGSGETNADGRVAGLIQDATSFEPGIYRIKFDVETYYKAKGIDCFYPFAEIAFHVKNTSEHFHVPLLISGFGFSTYRGS